MKRLLAAVALLFAATAASATFNLTITTSGPLGSQAVIVSSPAGISCPSTCTFAFAEGSTVTLTETALSTVAFVAWAGPDGCRSNLTSCRVPMTGAKAVTARFAPMLGVKLFGNGSGTVTNSSGTISCSLTTGCGDGAVQNRIYPTGSTVTLMAVADSSSSFTGWSGYGGCSTASTCTVTLDTYQLLTATFSSTGPFLIKVVVTGSGTVTSSPPGIACPPTCGASFSSGTVIQLSTFSTSAYRFGGWANGGCSGLTPCVVTSSTVLQGLGGNRSPAAWFYRNP